MICQVCFNGWFSSLHCVCEELYLTVIPKGEEE